jgi:hypothetical protein
MKLETSAQLATITTNTAAAAVPATHNNTPSGNPRPRSNGNQIGAETAAVVKRMAAPTTSENTK